MGFEERFGGFERGGVGGLMARERGKGKGERGLVEEKGSFGLEVRDGIWIRVLGGGG